MTADEEAPDSNLALFGGWVVFGLLVGFALLCSISSLIPALVLVIPALIVLGRWLEQRRGGSAVYWGIALGAASAPLFLAYLNRHGPGTYCHAISGGEECAEQWDPRPWLGIALALAAAGVAGFVLQARRARP